MSAAEDHPPPLTSARPIVDPRPNHEMCMAGSPVHVLISVSLVVVSTLSAVSAEKPLEQVATIALPNVEGRFDHLAYDPQTERLFVAALGNNTVEVLDVRNNVHFRQLTGFAEPQGVAVLAKSRTVAVANGQGTGVQFLGADDFGDLRSVRLGDDADNVRYETRTGDVYVGYGDGALARVDAASGTVRGEVRLAAHPESFQLEPSGPRIFVNVPNAGHLAVVDRVGMKVVATWPVTKAKANFPLALDAAGHRLFVGCRRPAVILVYDSTSGRAIASFDAVGDTDDLFFDADRQRLYVSGGEGFIDVFAVPAGGDASRIARVATAAGARTSLFVPVLGRLFLAVPHRGAQKAEIRVYQAR
jgi:DNA-binding beta-propeller fold protein YncE